MQASDPPPSATGLKGLGFRDFRTRVGFRLGLGCRA